ncbi:hypothetical protein SprV_0401494800 [Sparganum proliferum]
MLMDAYRGERPGIRIAYRTDGQLLNQRRMHFQSRVSIRAVHELVFADDCALSAATEGDMQRGMNLFSAACENFGLITNSKKTVRTQINVNGAQLQFVDNFTCVGSAGFRNTKIEYEVALRISKVRLRNKILPDFAVWSRDLDGVHETRTQTHPLPPQLSSSNTEAEVAGPDSRHGRTGEDRNHQHVRPAETTTTTPERHLVRIDDERLPERLFYGDIACMEISRWVHADKTVKTGAAIFTANRTIIAKDKRETCKSQVPPPPPPPHSANAQPPSTCPRSQRTFRAPSGLVGHLRINRNTRTAPTAVSPSTSPSPPTPSAEFDGLPEPPLPSSPPLFLYSSSSSPPPPPP